jgi:GNAT superfamily N-acetyltransferase
MCQEFISLEEISTSLDCEDQELRDRDRSCSRKSRVTTYYRALCDKDELAFVALDRNPDLDALVIYEIYVASHNRNKGKGTRVLAAIEDLARREGFMRTFLLPHPLDGNFPVMRLMAWYERHGYRPRVDCPSEFEKALQQVGRVSEA